ncbi:N4-gp56 family major capsid protein [Ectopseudomonas toyotomiensis]|uniref:Major capsid protein, N4-gp56 family n=1 Tax=Ectopseudomonas toyotomiensis TaxID=554344 RepID=A0A1I5R288_9GAMM|nr:N4-gp56 family major capsid protein [Pseudomonas toyotomiensis]PIA74306.1 N4-gp56 family major capsid protein [Pseudomonas toyotomiensis]SFP52664.1 major capsid protein, N4-gp56 family [Pseudomonas toyotomiensis]
MAVTNFARLNSKQKIVWSRDVWSAARDQMFVKKFLGTGPGAMIQRITELTKTEKGEKVLMQLVADLVEDGVIGDNEREGNEEEMQNFEVELNIDLISHQVRNKGKMADQKTVINFREQARDRLAYWLANRIDQLVFLTLSGISYALHNDGSTRVGSPFPSLSFAADVSAPSSKRHLMWNGTNLVTSNTASITSAFVASYKLIVDAIAYAKDHYIKPLMAGGKEYYVILVKPGTLAQLKKDADYQRAVVALAQKDGKSSPWFTGGTVTIDGAVIHEHRLVYSTTGASAGNKWGADGNVNGTRALLCGAQALGMADLGVPEWVEKKFDYDSKVGISVDKMFGLLKPKFYSIYDKSVEDFGVLAIDLFLG